MITINDPGERIPIVRPNGPIVQMIKFPGSAVRFQPDEQTASPAGFSRPAAAGTVIAVVLLRCANIGSTGANPVGQVCVEWLMAPDAADSFCVVAMQKTDF